MAAADGERPKKTNGISKRPFSFYILVLYLFLLPKATPGPDHHRRRRQLHTRHSPTATLVQNQTTNPTCEEREKNLAFASLFDHKQCTFYFKTHSPPLVQSNLRAQPTHVQPHERRREKENAYARSCRKGSQRNPPPTKTCEFERQKLNWKMNNLHYIFDLTFSSIKPIPTTTNLGSQHETYAGTHLLDAVVALTIPLNNSVLAPFQHFCITSFQPCVVNTPLPHPHHARALDRAHTVSRKPRTAQYIPKGLCAHCNVFVFFFFPFSFFLSFF